MLNCFYNDRIFSNLARACVPFKGSVCCRRLVRRIAYHRQVAQKQPLRLALLAFVRECNLHVWFDRRNLCGSLVLSTFSHGLGATVSIVGRLRLRRGWKKPSRSRRKGTCTSKMQVGVCSFSRTLVDERLLQWEHLAIRLCYDVCP